MSKAFGLAGIRIGWIATRDRALFRRLVALKDYTTICNAAPSEVLALIGLRNRDRVVSRSMSIIRSNLAILDDFMARHDDLFEWVRPCAGSVCFPRLTTGEIDRLADDLVAKCGVLLLPASQFGHEGNYFRLGYGRADMPQALALVDEFVA